MVVSPKVTTETRSLGIKRVAVLQQQMFLSDVTTGHPFEKTVNPFLNPWPSASIRGSVSFFSVAEDHSKSPGFHSENSGFTL